MGPNRSIGCSVTECRYHAKNEQLCNLDRINVSKCSNAAVDEKDTECASFQKE